MSEDGKEIQDQPQSPSRRRFLGLAVKAVLGGIGLGVTTRIIGSLPSDANRADQLMKPNSKETPEVRKLKTRLIANHVLENWVNEREDFGERNARQRIADAMVIDLANVDNEARNIKEGQVIAAPAVKQVSAVLKAGNTRMLSVDRKDAITQEPFKSMVGVENLADGGYALVGREIKPDGSLISESRLYPDGRTELTVDFTGPRYKNANPHILNDNHFPQATATHFAIMTEAVLNKF